VFDESAYGIEEMRLGYCVMLRGGKLENVWSMVFGGVHARHTSCMHGGSGERVRDDQLCSFSLATMLRFIVSNSYAPS
jgi:hypothetical protein